MSGQLAPDFLIGRIDRALAEVNLGRSLQLSAGGAVSSMALRVAALLPEVWAAHPGGEACDVYRGRHEPDCPHRGPNIFTTRTALARAVFGRRAGGKELVAVDDAIRELAHAPLVFDAIDPVTGFRVRYDATPIRLATLETARGAEALYAVTFDERLHASMLRGHVQRIPIELVQGLGGQRDFRVWSAITSQPRLAKLKPGESVSYAITGPKPSIDVERLGLPKRPNELRAAVRQTIERVNALDPLRHMELVPRKGGDGDKVIVHRLRAGAGVRRNQSGGLTQGERGFDVIGAGVRRSDRAQNGASSPSRDSTRDTLETARAREAHANSSSTSPGQRSPSSKRGSRPDVAALRAAGVRVSKAMVVTLDEIADRQKTKQLDGQTWSATVIEERPPETEDAFRYLLDVDRRLSDERFADADRRDRDWHAMKARERAEAAEIVAAIKERLRLEAVHA